MMFCSMGNEDATANTAAVRWTRIVVLGLLGTVIFGVCLFGTLGTSAMGASQNPAFSQESKVVITNPGQVLHNGTSRGDESKVALTPPGQALRHGTSRGDESK